MDGSRTISATLGPERPGRDERFYERGLPRAVLLLLVAGWAVFGAVLIPRAPFASGTDESISYVAFAVATKHWATEADFHRYGIDYYYYPPLYFFCFAPFFSYHPDPPGQYPSTPLSSEFSAGHYNLQPENAPRTAAPDLERLYRSAKFFSLILGLAVIASVIAAVRAIFPGPPVWWRCLLGATPVLTLPQFFYYSTLCNNDPLCNALGAGTFLAFVFAMLALEKKNGRRYFVWSGAAALFFGLNLLTKTTAFIFAPLMVLLALSSLLLNGTLRGRIVRCLGSIAWIGTLGFAGGGWWLVHKAFEGDWNSQIAARLGHPWAFVTTPLWVSWTWPGLILAIARSYFSLMSGPIHGLPDRIFILYLAVPAFTLFVAALLALRSIRDTGISFSVFLRPRFWLFIGGAGMIVANAGAILLNCRDMVTPYGRLLFPTLLPLQFFFVLVWSVYLRKRSGAFILFTAGNLFFSAGLFLAMAEMRIIPAIVQPPENIATLAPLTNPKRNIVGVWDVPIEQPMTLPRGKLVALRFKTERSLWPAIGAAIEGELVFPAAEGKEATSIPIETADIGNNDATVKWTEVRLSSAVTLSGDTRAVLRFHIVPPVFWVKRCAFALVTVNQEEFPRMGPLRLKGDETRQCLCLAAVYEPEK